jgi:hypothetical protein
MRGEPSLTAMPPPYVAVLSSMMHSQMVGEASYTKIPPPKDA